MKEVDIVADAKEQDQEIRNKKKEEKKTKSRRVSTYHIMRGLKHAVAWEVSRSTIKRLFSLASRLQKVLNWGFTNDVAREGVTI